MFPFLSGEKKTLQNKEYIVEAPKNNVLVPKETSLVILDSDYDSNYYLVNQFVAKIFVMVFTICI